MKQTWNFFGVVFVILTLTGCEEEETAEVSGSSSTEAPPAEEPANPDEEPAGESPGVAPELSATVDGAPFVTRGVLAHRLRESDEDIEIRLVNRSVSCESFDEDYRAIDGEPIVIINVNWPRAEGDTVALRAQEVHERLQFCEGRDTGRARCAPRAAEQGTLTVVEASPESGTLSLEVDTDEGTLSGQFEFTLCEH